MAKIQSFKLRELRKNNSKTKSRIKKFKVNAAKSMRNGYDFIVGIVARLFKHRHKWQVRGRSRYQNPTYRVCLKCRQAQQWDGGLNGKFIDCDAIPELDAQFDENDNYIFND